MKISVVIPTFNEEGVITACLQSLAGQKYPDFEVILVDDGSTDNSKLKIQNAKLQYKNLRLSVFSQDHKGPGAARNIGASKAKGEILVFVDADMTFDVNFLLKLTEPIVKGESRGTFSREEYVANWDSIWARCWNINQGWEPKRRHSKGYPDKQKVFRAILASEFNRAGGFTPGGYTDDWSLSEKLGYSATASSGAIFYHANPESLIEIYKQAKWSAKREYKLGCIGRIGRLMLASLPFSVVIGIVNSFIHVEPGYIVFKIVYDLGVFVGILEMWLGGRMTK